MVIISVLVHTDSTSCTYGDPRQLAHHMEMVLHLDQPLTDHGKAEVLIDNYKTCFRRAIHWANMGFTVSIEPPAGPSNEPSGTESDRKKAKAETSCKKKNMELLTTDPPRPFLSSTVAYSLALEIIGLLNGLLVDQDSVQVWRNAIEDMVKYALQSVPLSLPSLKEYCQSVHECVDKCQAPPFPRPRLLSASLANACFAVLGSFKDTLRVGTSVTVIGKGVAQSTGTVISISEQRGVANIALNDRHAFGTNQILEVLLSRLRPPDVSTLPLKQLGIEKELCEAIKSVLGFPGFDLESSYRNGCWERGYGTCEALFRDDLN